MPAMGKGEKKWETLGTNGRSVRGVGLLVMTEEPGIFPRIPRQGGMREVGGLGERYGRSTHIQGPLSAPPG